MYHYKVIYSYLENGNHYRHTDFIYANCAADATRECRLRYKSKERKNFRVEAVLIEPAGLYWDFFIEWKD